MPPLYELQNLNRIFESRKILDIESLVLEEEKIYALLGPNGSGKTTLMRILSFLDSPSGGTLRFRGHEVSANRVAQFRQGVVLVPQFPVMFTGSLLYNIEYPMALKKIPAAERRREALNLLEAVNLANLAGAPARHLSGGEAQRASIARALAAGAKVLLFDEPTASVDHRSAIDIVALIRNIHATKKLSILISTHQLSLAENLCRRHIFLEDGRVVERRLLNGGLNVRPARLVSVPENTKVDRRVAIVFSQGTQPNTTAFSGTVCGLYILATGTVVQLRLPNSYMESFLLENKECENMAIALRLGDIVELRAERQGAL
jgi:ABC-type multidrug transport system ATPase subunit